MMMTQLDRLEALAEKSQRAPGHIETHDRIDLWVCEDCGFGFDAVHEDTTIGGEDGIYTCPCCLEAAVWPHLPDLIRVARAAKATWESSLRHYSREGVSCVDTVPLMMMCETLAPLYREAES